MHHCSWCSEEEHVAHSYEGTQYQHLPVDVCRKHVASHTGTHLPLKAQRSNDQAHSREEGVPSGHTGPRWDEQVAEDESKREARQEKHHVANLTEQGNVTTVGQR